MQQDSFQQKTLTLNDLKQFAHESGASYVSGKDCLMMSISSFKTGNRFLSAFRIDCLLIFFCSEGEVILNIDFKRVSLHAGSLLVLSPDKLIEIVGDSSMPMQSYALFLSREFMNLMTFDSNTMDFSNVKLEAPPVLQLSEPQSKLILRYFELLRQSSEINPDNDIYAVNILRSLTSALLYQMMLFKAQENVAEHGERHKVARKNYYVRDFMKLVTLHFREQRSVNFYADKLFISAKYLSLIIKEATGYTATELIDHHVILEAKNLLRFSGRNIQQVAYDLNFHNQSSFGKYFKHQTGLSPSQFRKS